MKGIAAIKKLLRRMKSIRRIVRPEGIESILARNEDYILDLVRDKQLYEMGVNALGVEISSYAPYHPLTRRYKRAAGESQDRVTLRDTGAFHKSLYIEFQEGQFLIKASDPKTEDLLAKYGGEVLGLTKEHVEQIKTEILRPKMAEDFERRMTNDD